MRIRIRIRNTGKKVCKFEWGFSLVSKVIILEKCEDLAIVPDPTESRN